MLGRGLLGTESGVSPAMLTDPLIAFALGMFTLQRVEMYLRAKRLLEEARGGADEGRAALLRSCSGWCAPLRPCRASATASRSRTSCANGLPASGLVLEIASGTGEHAVSFRRTFPDLDWQPSDIHPDALASIAAWRAQPACRMSDRLSSSMRRG